MSTDEQAIREAISEASQKLADLRRGLESVDGELEALSGERHRYELLNRVCGSLEELEQLGDVKLFWGESSDLHRTAEHVRQVRQRVRKFDSRVADIEKRRRSIAEQLEAQNESVAVLGEDLVDALEEEESRRAEWVIEREEADLPYRAQAMPWMRGLEEDGRFRRSLAASSLVAVLVALLLPLVDLPLPDRAELIEVPERVARLIREAAVPLPQPVIEEPVPEEQKPEPEPEPLLAEETPPKPAPDPVAAPAPQPAKQAAEQQVQSKGILAFRESFASRAESKPSAQLGSQARLGNAGDVAVGRPERSMVTTTAPGSSGGINLGDISRNVGGGGAGEQIAGVQVTRVASSIAGGGGGEDRPLSGGQFAGRTDEEIQIVFDRYKASLYRLYNRELRNDPTLRGQLVIRLTIEPDGSVSLCALESSDMEAPTLAQQVVARIRDFDFGAKDGIVAMTIIYPIDFLPAA